MKKLNMILSCFFACMMIAQICTAHHHIYGELLESKADAVVSVNAVMSMELRMMGQGEDEESRVEFSGVLVNESGLVMVPYNSFSGENIKRIFSGMGAGIDVNVSLQDLTVVVDGEEYDGYLVATDSDFDLAFIQLENTEGKTFSYVDLSKSQSPEIGSTIYYLSRLGEGFDYAPHVREARITGTLNRPRQAYITNIGMAGLGMPVFNVEGEVVGIATTLQDPTAEGGGSTGGGMGFGAMFQSMGSSATGQSVVLSVDFVLPLIRAAEERAGEE